MSEVQEVKPQEAYDAVLAAENDIIVDVRTDEEWNEAHAQGARHIVLDDLHEYWDELRGYDNVYFICRSGGRSEMATVQAMTAGLNNARNITGGTKRWKKKGLPME